MQYDSNTLWYPVDSARDNHDRDICTARYAGTSFQLIYEFSETVFLPTWSMQVNIWKNTPYLCCARAMLRSFAICLHCHVFCYVALRYHKVSVALCCWVMFCWIACILLLFFVLGQLYSFIVFLCFILYTAVHVRNSTEEISGRMLTPSTPLFTARCRRLLPSTSTSYRKSSTIPCLSAAIKQNGFRVKPTRYQLLFYNWNMINLQ